MMYFMSKVFCQDSCFKENMSCKMMVNNGNLLVKCLMTGASPDL